MSFLPAVSAGLSIMGSLGGMFGGGDDKPEAPKTYQPQWALDADRSAIYGTNQLPSYNAYSQNYGQAQDITQNLVNNPYAAQFQQGANATAGLGWNTGLNQTGAGNDLMAAGQGMLPYAQSILQTGFDPQNDLYKRTLQQTTEQQRAGQTARGIAMTPYGAGLENQALSNFNMDWQNNLLNRQNTAAQGAGYLANSGGNAINLGQNVSTLGLQTLQNASSLPYATANTIGGNQLGALGTFGQFGKGATDLANVPIQNYLQYLGLTNQAGGVANQNYANQLTAQNNDFNQQQKLGSNLGSGLSGLGSWYNGGGLSQLGFG